MKNVLYLGLVATLLFACEPEPTPPPPTPDIKYADGILITNEGPFSSGSGTLSYYNPTTNAVENDIFQTANGYPVGSILQSVYSYQATNRAYLVVNNSQKVIVANRNTMAEVAEITGFSSPRYFTTVASQKAYVTDWVSNTVKVINLNTNTIDKSLPTGQGPERMLVYGSRVLVANSGGFGVDSTLTVINTFSDELQSTIPVGHNPNSMVIDANGQLWVLCGGINDFVTPANSTPGKLIKIDLATFTKIAELTFPNAVDHPTGLVKNNAGTLIYWLSNGYAGNVVEMNISAPALPSAAKINGTFYSLVLDPSTDEIYTTDALDFQQDGVMYRFSSGGALIDSVLVGIIPGGFSF